MELPKRKPTRLKGYDYSTPGMYFITVCVKDRKQLLGKIVGCGNFDAPKMLLSEYGQILEKYINLMNEKYPHINIDKYVIMPNHIHIIVVITERHAGRSLHDVMRWFETMATNEYIRYVKNGVLKSFNKRLFQKSYHDHIIRGEKDYREIWEYIDTNVVRWENDKFYND